MVSKTQLQSNTHTLLVSEKWGILIIDIRMALKRRQYQSNIGGDLQRGIASHTRFDNTMQFKNGSSSQGTPNKWLEIRQSITLFNTMVELRFYI